MQVSFRAVQKTIKPFWVVLSIPESSSVKYVRSEAWQDLGRWSCVPKVFMVRQVVGFSPISIKLLSFFLSQWQNCSETRESFQWGSSIE